MDKKIGRINNTVTKEEWRWEITKLYKITERKKRRKEGKKGGMNKESKFWNKDQRKQKNSENEGRIEVRTEERK